MLSLYISTPIDIDIPTTATTTIRRHRERSGDKTCAWTRKHLRGEGLKVPCAPKWFDSRVSNNQNEETLSQKLAQVPEQSEFTHSALLRSCRALSINMKSPTSKGDSIWFVFISGSTCAAALSKFPNRNSTFLYTWASFDYASRRFEFRKL